MSITNRPKTAWTMLFRVVDRLRAKSARNVAIPNMKITLGKMRIINYLFVREGEPPMVKEIAEMFGLTSGAVSQTVDALAADGVVERIPSSVDRRSVHVSLTPFGKSIRKQLEAYLNDVMTGILDEVPEEKQEAFLEVLQDMSETFTETQRIAREAIKRGSRHNSLIHIFLKQNTEFKAQYPEIKNGSSAEEEPFCLFWGVA